MPTPTPPLRVPPTRRWLRRLAVWLVELVTVIIGVYVAFALSYRSSQRQTRQRRQQLLVWIEQNYSEVLTNSRAEAPKLRKAGADFKRRLGAGETPPLQPLSWRSDYEASDSLSVLQSGGYDLLEVETVRDMREVESTLRALVGTLTRFQRLNDTMILPNAGREAGFFYDLDTRRLRPPYLWYADTFDEVAGYLEEAQPKITKLLEQTRAERQRR